VIGASGGAAFAATIALVLLPSLGVVLGFEIAPLAAFLDALRMHAGADGPPDSVLTAQVIRDGYGAQTVVQRHPMHDVPQVLAQPGQGR
jgi:hypothetical protein